MVVADRSQLCAFQPDANFSAEDKVDVQVNKTRKLWSYARMLWRNNPTSRHPEIQNMKELFEKASGSDRPCKEEPASDGDSSDISSGFWRASGLTSYEDVELGCKTLFGDDELDGEYEPRPTGCGEDVGEGGESESPASDGEYVEPEGIPHPKPRIEDETSDWDIEGAPELPGDEERHRALARSLLESDEPWLSIEPSEVAGPT